MSPELGHNQTDISWPFVCFPCDWFVIGVAGKTCIILCQAILRVFQGMYYTLMMHIFSIVLVLRIAESRLFTMCNTNTRLFYKWRWHHFLWGLSFFSFTIATTAGCILYCLYILFRWKKNCVTRVHTWMCNSKLSSIMIHWGSTTRVRIITT